MHAREEFITISDEECLILAEDVQTTFARLSNEGMKVIKLPAADQVYGMKAFLLDISGVLIEIRQKRNSAHY